MLPPAPDIARARRKRCAYIYSPALVKAADHLPVHRTRKRGQPGRHAIAHSLIAACGLLDYCRVVKPRPATTAELLEFHDEDYVDALRDVSAGPGKSRLLGKQWNRSDEGRNELADFGLEDDSAPFKFVAQHAAWVCGGTLAAANELIAGNAEVSINWTGGRHHASRGAASGWCYLNDVVLGVLRLQRSFGRVLVLDIDVHAGCGTESAFYHTPSVLTVSFHLREPGFFPASSGSPGDKGSGLGVDFNINVPLERGTTGVCFVPLFCETAHAAVRAFRPDAVVLVCGVDTLWRDPHGGFALTSDDIAECVQMLRKCCCRPKDSGLPALPLLLLGGGGYQFAEVARAWAAATASAFGAPSLPDAVPEHENFALFAPGGFRMASARPFMSTEPKRDTTDSDESNENQHTLPSWVCEQLRRVASRCGGKKGIAQI